MGKLNGVTDEVGEYLIKPGRVVDVELALDGAALPSDPVAETEIVLDQGGQVSRVAVEVERRGS